MREIHKSRSALNLCPPRTFVAFAGRIGRAFHVAAIGGHIGMSHMLNGEEIVLSLASLLRCVDSARKSLSSASGAATRSDSERAAGNRAS